MTKYIVYAVDDENPVVNGSTSYKPIKKFKREFDAVMFVENVKNLAKYGCMIMVKQTDSDGSYTWNPDTMQWERTDA